MVGRREETAAPQPLNTDQGNGASNFRRKLSHGWSFISNPLSQRKTTPGRHPPGRASLPAPRPVLPDDAVEPRDSDRLLSPIHDSPKRNGSPMQQTTPNDDSLDKGRDAETTPKPLPRARTMSYIPRPSMSGSESLLIEPDLAVMSRPSLSTLQQQARATPTKTPTPSPPVPGRRKSSPRQYIPSLTTQQAKHVAAGNAFASASEESPSKASVRSYTTPNLVKATSLPQPTSFMVPRKSMVQKPSNPREPHRPTLKENTPTTQRTSGRLSKIQENSPRRDSLAAPTKMANRRSFGPGSVFAQGKHPVRTTPTKAGRRPSSQRIPQSPLTAKRTPPKKQSPNKPAISARNSNGSSIAQPRLLGPVAPPTPPKINHAAARPALPRASTERDLRRKPVATPSKRGAGVGMLSRSQSGANNEVKEYMPALYWAGRFQSRYDQWRTEAMKAELNSDHVVEGLLGKCKLSQEKIAACYVFLQLRDLCVSNQAADSLWEFEYKYRMDNKMLGTAFDLAPLSSRRPEDSTARQGSFGQALRRLTPRKSSFVNLLKGKGWNKDCDKVTDGTNESNSSFTKSQGSSSGDS